MDIENFKPVQGFPGYLVDIEGNLWSTLGRGKANNITHKRYLHKLSGHIHSNGYIFYALRKSYGTYVSVSGHRAVCLGFYGYPPRGMTASHKNGIRTDNRPENLCWETMSDNQKRKLEHGTHDRGYNNSRSCLTYQSVKTIRRLLVETELRHQDIAELFGVSRTTISRISNKHRYQ